MARDLELEILKNTLNDKKYTSANLPCRYITPDTYASI